MADKLLEEPVRRVRPLAVKTRNLSGGGSSKIFTNNMYAIVEVAGQQFKVEAGKEIFVNRLAEATGTAVEFNKVLLLDNDGEVKVGAPYVEGAVVKATVLDDSCKGKKVLVFKKKRRKGYQKCNGHRQYLSKIQINEIA